MRKIERTDIVGARVVDIHETYELINGLDNRRIYFTVDRGFAFTLPNAGRAWTTVESPPEAKRLPDEYESHNFAAKRGWFGRTRFERLPSTKIDIVRQIKSRCISGVYCEPIDKELGFHYPDDGILVFEDGSQASNTIVAPHGTGAAGLYFFPTGSPQCTPVERMVDYFTIPLENASTD